MNHQQKNNTKRTKRTEITIELEKEKKVPWHHSIGLDAVFEAVKLPARVADLNSGLTYVYAYDLSHLSNSILLSLR